MGKFTTPVMNQGARFGEKFQGSMAAFSDKEYFTGAQNTVREKMIDPLITGYSFIKWIHIPDWLGKGDQTAGMTDADLKHMLQKNFKSLSGLDNLTLNTGTTTAGFSTNETHWATNIQKATGFSCNYQEYTGSPMSELFNLWVSGIRDPRTNVAMYPRWNGGHYGAKFHTGEAMYIQMRPDAYCPEASGKNIEYACYFTNVMPTVMPRDHRNYTSGTNDLVEFEQQFTGDQHEGPNVMAQAQNIIKAQDDMFVFTNEAGFQPVRGA